MTGQDVTGDAAPAAGAASPSGTAPADVPASPETPEAARRLFGERVGLAEGFVRALATTGVTHGLIGPREVPRLWERHVLNCAVISELVPEGVTVVDVGSGAGLPGLALAVARPDLTLHLVEPMQRRTDWLSGVVADLGLTGVHVHHARAQDVVGTVQAPVATARAVTRIGQLTAWCAPLLAPAGVLLAIKGRSIDEELRADARSLAAAGSVRQEVVRCGAEYVDPPTTVCRVVLGDEHRPGTVVAPPEDLRRGRAGKGRRRR